MGSGGEDKAKASSKKLASVATHAEGLTAEGEIGRTRRGGKYKVRRQRN